MIFAMILDIYDLIIRVNHPYHGVNNLNNIHLTILFNDNEGRLYEYYDCMVIELPIIMNTVHG